MTVHGSGLDGGMPVAAVSASTNPSADTSPSAGYDFVVVANRLPLNANVEADGTVSWTESPGGLVTALTPLLEKREGIWVGWSGLFSDDEPPPPPERADGAQLAAIPLSRAEFAQYYEGFSNSAIWPLYHDAIVTPAYHRSEWEVYRTINQRFADTVASIAARGATVWVHDYQLQLVPAMLRVQRPDLRIGFFLHIPFPPTELFAQLPWRREVIEGLLGADLVGFHVPGGAKNFLALTHRLCGLDPTEHSVDVPDRWGPRTVRVDAFPISIDTAAVDALAASETTRARAAELRRDLGNPTTVLLGVDRLDYTKGIDVRLKAYYELLEDGELDPAETVLVQVATPSREGVEEYKRIRDEIELVVGRVTGDHGRIGSPPMVYLHQSLPREELSAFYVAADVMLVTPLRDGMNLVCKEYVASRVDDDGALVLSEFTGAASELIQAWLVNPYDAVGVKQAILEAVRATPEERTTRMKAMRQHLVEHDVEHWASAFLGALDTGVDPAPTPGTTQPGPA